ncbi:MULTISPECIES: AbiTii domain-containing protein [Anaeromyxobacter]|uniref:AbiTii domain-containing protein n=1 Tax=Anaeromyxobacter TaxID=161492 RepID=UPI001F569352|nr:MULTISPECIES: hypothetical protein [unclassified Anaeromyxobacter]
MASLIEELQREALDPKASIPDLLRKAKAVAMKLKVSDAAEWIEHELSGYPAGAEIPSYREISGKPRYFNPYHGWVPLIFGDPETQEKASKRKTRQPISEIMDILARSEKGGGAMFSYPAAVVADLGKHFDLEVPDAGMEVSLPSLAGILDEVRTRILDWAMKLEAVGVRGDGMSFSTKDQEKAAGVHINIGSIGSMVGAIGPIAAGATVNVTGQVTQGQIELLLSLARQVQALSDRMDLSVEAAKEMVEAARALEEEAKRSPPDAGRIRLLLNGMKGVASNALGNLVSSGVLEMIQRISL